VSAAHLFRRALAARPGRLHVAAHSHHPWPDAVLAAHARAATDALLHLDEKWDSIFGELWPRLQRRVASRLGLPDPALLAFASNTHELLARVLSCFPAGAPVRLLTTDAEFHSARRQFARWAEAGRVALDVVAAEPFEDFPARLAAAFDAHDLLFVSHVFFDSGYVYERAAELCAALPPAPFVVLDGYHAFNALPVDLAPVASRAFYLAGGYKYAMAGEGACFLHAPPGYGARPELTGWFAGFAELERADYAGAVGYPTDGRRFLGSTFDPTALYRLDAALALLDEEGWTPARIHAHVGALQARVVERLPAGGPGALDRARLVPGVAAPDRGHFLTFRVADAGAAQDALAREQVVCDHRRDRLRLGFGIYHAERDVDELLARARRAGVLR
jgi:selenocysteine lyase/cysteine desulfurase